MVPSKCWLMKLMVFFVLLFTFLQISSTQPLLYGDDDDDQAQLDNLVFTYHLADPGRLPSYNHHKTNFPQNVYEDHLADETFYRNNQFSPGNLQWTKRIIMLPRIGRR
ncbi:unnamed protein product [Rotaria socialis]|uniref:Uncharacterized protein n=1 Tax=Rotaria socialis TaxID=392032 RepID=A0A817Q5K7_9BILA|nr:unnamed protein product [Rotaria socialis]CAF3397565.1 unnamed protein product [Rotaria socialis]CAF3503454.1 unnamed protein product [Rotaria socialis]CAF3641877.1 unnamed protein product [Rotaria socialis]CAF3758881.1 unnamed protein product [Rotaria socialis]